MELLKKLNLNTKNLFFIGGPCVIEDEKLCYTVAKALKEITQKLEIPFIFKASYDKANRSSVNSFRGPGIDKGLEILNNIKQKLSVPVLSDIHGIEQIEKASAVLDIIQIPAFLCRQTDLLTCVAKTGIIINVKKGQFMAPWDMKNVIDKILSTGNDNIILTERGSTFGYNNLVSDMRSIMIMRNFGYPVVFDATHSVQLPGGDKDKSSGERQFAGPLALSACAAGCDGLFFEVHPEPEKALCDGPNMVNFKEIESILEKAVKIKNIIM